MKCCLKGIDKGADLTPDFTVYEYIGKSYMELFIERYTSDRPPHIIH